MPSLSPARRRRAIGRAMRPACAAKSRSKICRRPIRMFWQLNLPRVVGRPAGAQLNVPPGFKVDMYASGFRDPRFLLTAPKGDLFVTESRANQIKVLRDPRLDYFC
jgi:hypothetical protein